jgi:uncharacterized protein YukE
MGKAVVDHEDLRRFASELKRFNDDLKERIGSIHHQFSRLGETWRDQEHVKFAETFERMLRSLSRFVDYSENHIPFLLRKAERIQEYLKQR